MKRSAYVVVQILGAASMASAQEGWVRLSPAQPPCFEAGKRYVDCGNGTVTDQLTGLVWLTGLFCNALNGWSWDIATIEIANLADGHCDLADGSSPGDWRLPTKAEWEEMMAQAKAMGCNNPALTNDAGDGCCGDGPSSLTCLDQFDQGWTATTTSADRQKAWIVYPWNGVFFSSVSKTSSVTQAWPVRRMLGAIKSEPPQ